MTVYVDSSVLLRVVLAERGVLREWARITQPVSSQLIKLECLRAIDRARIKLRIEDPEIAERRAAVMEQLEAFELIVLNWRILERAAEPFPTLVGSLDAIHLASAVAFRSQVPALSFATHDRQLAMAARALGFHVLGAS